MSWHALDKFSDKAHCLLLFLNVTEWKWCGFASLLGCVVTIEMVREKVRVVKELRHFQ